MIKVLAVAIFCLLIQACTSVGSVTRPQDYSAQRNIERQTNLIDDAPVEDQDRKISELLGYQVRLPKQNRIALMKLSGHSQWRYYSNDFAELSDSMVVSLVDQLRASKRVYDASFLPALLLPEKRSESALRLAAARFQADLLLAYRSSCQTYRKYRMVSPDKTNSFCTVESVLLDVRSGIVVKSVVSSQNYQAQKDDGDTNLSETVKKAELEAIAKALDDVAGEIVDFLDDVPVAK